MLTMDKLDFSHVFFNDLWFLETDRQTDLERGRQTDRRKDGRTERQFFKNIIRQIKQTPYKACNCFISGNPQFLFRHSTGENSNRHGLQSLCQVSDILLSDTTVRSRYAVTIHTASLSAKTPPRQLVSVSSAERKRCRHHRKQFCHRFTGTT